MMKILQIIQKDIEIELRANVLRMLCASRSAPHNLQHAEGSYLRHQLLCSANFCLFCAVSSASQLLLGVCLASEASMFLVAQAMITIAP